MNARKKKITLKKRNAKSQFFKALKYQVSKQMQNFSELVCVCIGTELVIGDSLGPLVGQRLQRLRPYGITVYGTLGDSIHAENLCEKISSIKKKHPHACILAVDASFGTIRQLGCVYLQSGPIYPGLGVAKNLPPIGDISITGIVCTPSLDGNEKLARVPLSLLLPQVDVIADGIAETCQYFYVKNYALPERKMISARACRTIESSKIALCIHKRAIK